MMSHDELGLIGLCCDIKPMREMLGRIRPQILTISSKITIESIADKGRIHCWRVKAGIKGPRKKST